MTQLKGLVLTGGFSSRMGCDKAELIYPRLGIKQNQRQYCYSILSRYCSKTYISCRREQQQDIQVEFPSLCDLESVQGPMMGLISAFQEDPCSAWFVIPCDMPLIDEEFLRRLIQHRNTKKICTVLRNPETGFLEPLLGIWEPEGLFLLNKSFERGERSLSQFLQDQECEVLEQIAAADSFKNVNSPDEFADAVQILLKKDKGRGHEF